MHTFCVYVCEGHMGGEMEVADRERETEKTNENMSENY